MRFLILLLIFSVPQSEAKESPLLLDRARMELSLPEDKLTSTQLATVQVPELAPQPPAIRPFRWSLSLQPWQIKGTTVLEDLGQLNLADARSGWLPRLSLSWLPDPTSGWGLALDLGYTAQELEISTPSSKRNQAQLHSLFGSLGILFRKNLGQNFSTQGQLAAGQVQLTLSGDRPELSRTENLKFGVIGLAIHRKVRTENTVFVGYNYFWPFGNKTDLKLKTHSGLIGCQGVF